MSLLAKTGDQMNKSPAILEVESETAATAIPSSLSRSVRKVTAKQGDGISVSTRLWLLGFVLIALNAGRSFPEPLDRWEKVLEWFSFEGIAYGNGQFVAFGLGPNKYYAYGYAYTSPDARRWTRQLMPKNQGRGLAFGNGVFVMTATGRETGVVLTSTDGNVWEETYANPSGGYQTYENVQFLNGRFFVTGTVILTSSDGRTWGPLQSATSFNQIVHGNQAYVATDRSGRILQSEDAITWTERLPGETEPFFFSYGTVSFGNGVFVAANQNGLFRSLDGSAWSRVNDELSGSARSGGSLQFVKDRFMAVVYGGGGAHVFTSLDGLSWNPATIESLTSFRAATTDGTNIVLAGDAVVSSASGTNWVTLVDRECTPVGVHDIINGVAVFANSYPNFTTFLSTNASEWVRHEFRLPDRITSVARIEKTFFALPANEGGLYTSQDATTWERRLTEPNYTFAALVKAGDQYVALGSLPTSDGSSAQPALLTSPDAIHWTSRFLIETPPPSFIASPTFLVYGNGTFVASGVSEAFPVSSVHAYVSTNGTNWAARSYSAGNPFLSMAFGEGVFSAVMLQLSEIRSSVDGMNWVPRIQPGLSYNRQEGGLLSSVAYGNGRFLAAGGRIDGWSGSVTNVVFSSANGTNWFPRKGPRTDIPGKVFFAGNRFYLLNGEMVYRSDSLASNMRFTGATALSDNEFRLTFDGPPGGRVTIHSSSNLLTWKLEAAVPNNSGTSTYTTPLAQQHQFFKLERE